MEIPGPEATGGDKGGLARKAGLPLFYVLLAAAAFSHSLAAVILGLLLAIQGAYLVRRRERFPLSPVQLTLIFVMCWSFLTALLHGVSLRETGRYYYYLPVFLVPLFSKYRQHFGRAFNLALLLVTIAIVLSFIQAYAGFRLPAEFQFYRGERRFGLPGHPIPVAGIYTAFALISVSLAFFGVKSKKTAIFHLACATTLAAGVLLSQSRSFYIALPLALFLLAALVRSRKLLLATLAGLIAAGAVIISSDILTGRISTFFDPSFYSNYERVAMWKTGLKVTAESWQNFLMGIGHGAWRERSAELLGAYAPGITFPFWHIHNAYIQVLMETGLIGLSLYLFFFFTLLRRLAQGLRYAVKDSFEHAFLSGALGLVIAWLTANLFDVPGYPGLLLIFHIFIGMALACVPATRPVAGA